MESKWYIVLLCVTLIISVASLSLSLCRIEPVTLDWLGILVGVLALLTSVLLGWQVFSIINLRGMEGQLKKLEEISRKGDSQAIGKAYDGIATLYITSLPDRSKTTDELINDHLYGYLLFTALAMAMQSEAGNYEYCESIIGHLLKMEQDKIKISTGQRNNIFDIAVKISGQSKISNFQDYLRWLAILKE